MPEVELHLVNAQDPVEESQTHGLARDAIVKHREALAEGAAANARALIAKAGLSCTFSWHFGDAAHVLADFASSQPCHLIVMGTQGAGAMQTLLLGSVAQRTLHLADVPVTLVK